MAKNKEYKHISLNAVVYKRILEIKKSTGMPLKLIVAKAVDLLCKQMEKENGNGKGNCSS